MKRNQNRMGILLFTLAILLPILACSVFPADTNPPEAPSAPTPTPTKVIAGGQAESSPCDNLSGFLEMQVLAGPAQGTGLEEIAVGEIPFSTTQADRAYPVQGAGSLSYHEVLTEEWGTYTLNLDMDAAISGECLPDEGNPTLDLRVDASGEQLLEVRADGFQGDYPWSGSHQLDLVFPLEEGARVEGEGWAFILHLDD